MKYKKKFIHKGKPYKVTIKVKKKVVDEEYIKYGITKIYSRNFMVVKIRSLNTFRLVYSNSYAELENIFDLSYYAKLGIEDLFMNKE
ncbi:hypothetical protein D3C71_1205750 [compost metagenome]